MSLEPRIRERLDALGPAPRAELLHVEMLPDSEREAKADEIVERGRSPGWWQSPGQVVGAPDGLDLLVLDTVERSVAFFRPGPELPDSVPADVLGDVPGPGPTPLLDRSQEPSEWPLLLPDCGSASTPRSAPRADLLHVLMLPDFERADRI